MRDLDAALVDGDPPNRGWSTVLANRLGDVTPEPLIVIDDLHELDSAATYHGLRDLIELLPETVHLIAMTRGSPLGRWRTGR